MFSLATHFAPQDEQDAKGVFGRHLHAGELCRVHVHLSLCHLFGIYEKGYSVFISDAVRLEYYRN